MSIKLNSANGSITISPEDGSGNAAVTFPRAGFASLASPTFTGTPAAPTASTGTNTTQIATTAFVQTEVTGLVDSAPSTLNTLNELAAALGDDANFSTTVTNSIATKLPLAGGTMTGNLDLNDNVKARFGTGNDLEIYHNGSASYISDQGTGNLVLGAADSIVFQNAAHDENMLVASQNGAVSLYYDNSIKIATTTSGVDITGVALTDGVTVDGTLDIEEVYEKVAVETSTTGTITFDTTAQAVQLYTANQAANRTINFTNVNSNLAVGQSLTVSISMTQGSTAYYLNAYQVDSSSVTPKWAGGSAPTAGNASSIDTYTFTIIKTADATFTVLASLTQFA